MSGWGTGWKLLLKKQKFPVHQNPFQAHTMVKTGEIFLLLPPPLVLQIVAAVVSHERALKAQAKKMNVDSLRSNKVRS